MSSSTNELSIKKKKTPTERNMKRSEGDIKDKSQPRSFKWESAEGCGAGDAGGGEELDSELPLERYSRSPPRSRSSRGTGEYGCLIDINYGKTGKRADQE